MREFKVQSFDIEKAHLTNGMCSHLNMRIGKCTGNEDIELQDGTKIYMRKNRKNTEGLIYQGYWIKLFPPAWIIKDATYNGKKVLKVETDYSISKEIKWEFDQLVNDEHLILTVEGMKTKPKVKYSPKAYAIDILYPIADLDLDGEYKFNPIKEIRFGVWHSNEMSFSYGGGGYGEKYYVTHANVNTSFYEYYFGRNITYEFRHFIQYGVENGNWDDYKTQDWIKELSNPNNWEVEVEDVPYEGYSVSGYKYTGSLNELNNLIKEHISKFKGVKKIDWKQAQVTI